VARAASSLRATALRGLTHPLCWLAIGALLINDHVLKRAAPSALTGKLSDFAGLFFFPFLAAAIAGLFLDRRRSAPRWSAPLIFALTGAWFAAIKTLPWANALTVAALTRLVGPAQIVRDPTDLIALAALWPAWRLWRRLESAPGAPARRQAVFTLALASLATMATSCLPVLGVERLMIYEGRVYAWISESTLGGGRMPTSPIIQSDDGGKTWQPIALEKAPQEVAEELQQYVTLPVIDCDPEAPQTCYRISGAEIVEGSADGGQTWNVVWKIPTGRRKFVEKYLNSSLGPCGKGFDFGPYDLALLPTIEGTVVIVATGKEGILVRTPDGQWERRSVLTAEPTPYSSSGIAPVLGEIALLLVGAFSTWIVATTIVWTSILLPKSRDRTGKSSWWGIVPALGAILIIISLIGLLMLEIEGLETSQYENYSIIFLTLPGITFASLTWSWWRIKRSSPAPAAVTLAQWTCGLLPLAMLAAGFPLEMWGRGTIAIYEVAAAISLAVLLGLYGIGYVLLRKVSVLVSTAALRETEAGGGLAGDTPGAAPETNPSNELAGRPFFMAWVSAHLAGGIVGMAFALMAGIFVMRWSLNTLSIAQALILSGLQSLILRQRHPTIRWWGVVTAVSSLAGNVMGALALLAFPAIASHAGWGIFTLAVITGANVGISQWVLLRRYFKRAGWWIFANLVSAFLIAVMMHPASPLLRWMPNFIVLVVGIAIGGLITGATYLWLARQPQSHAGNEP